MKERKRKEHKSKWRTRASLGWNMFLMTTAFDSFSSHESSLHNNSITKTKKIQIDPMKWEFKKKEEIFVTVFDHRVSFSCLFSVSWALVSCPLACSRKQPISRKLFLHHPANDLKLWRKRDDYETMNLSMIDKNCFDFPTFRHLKRTNASDILWYKLWVTLQDKKMRLLNRQHWQEFEREGRRK